MKLSILNRLNLSKLLHSDYIQERLKHRFNFLEWSMNDGIIKKITISDEEQTLVSLTQENGQLFWNSEKDPLKEIEFSALEKDFLIVLFKELDGAKQIDSDNGPLYKLFVVGE